MEVITHEESGPFPVLKGGFRTSSLRAHCCSQQLAARNRFETADTLLPPFPAGKYCKTALKRAAKPPPAAPNTRQTLPYTTPPRSYCRARRQQSKLLQVAAVKEHAPYLLALAPRCRLRTAHEASVKPRFAIWISAFMFLAYRIITYDTGEIL
ncbi:hypothetical protein NPIL_613261 [Nephila pilipes]|uniref:Uncharacterized protein n=1 Tax=Nephila pilipes TaxID=299642 RepID=A0A8X6QUN1_NEPPI|nr:hypothetical protein NPIL_613261 [Nephila pilipes]